MKMPVAHYGSYTLLIAVLIYSVLPLSLGNNEGVPNAPERPSQFSSAVDVKNYLTTLRHYYSVVSRPRFGKRSGWQNSDNSGEKRSEEQPEIYEPEFDGDDMDVELRGVAHPFDYKGRPRVDDKRGVPHPFDYKGRPRVDDKRGVPHPFDYKGRPRVDDKRGVPHPFDYGRRPRVDDKRGVPHPFDYKGRPRVDDIRGVPHPFDYKSRFQRPDDEEENIELPESAEERGVEHSGKPRFVREGEMELREIADPVAYLDDVGDKRGVEHPGRPPRRAYNMQDLTALCANKRSVSHPFDISGPPNRQNYATDSKDSLQEQQAVILRYICNWLRQMPYIGGR